MTDNLILGIDFGGKKAKEQEEITNTLRELGKQTPANFGWHEPGTADLNGVPVAEE